MCAMREIKKFFGPIRGNIVRIFLEADDEVGL